MGDRFSIGVDLGGTNLRIASYADGEEFLDLIQMPTRLAEGRDAVVRDMCEGIRALAERNYGGRRLAGIGIGSPGPLELPAGILRNPPNLHGWDGFNLRAAVESGVGQAIFLDGDANVAALAEQKLGAGQKHGIESLCVLTLGTGVGNGLIMDGRIWQGSTGMGGEGGHLIVKDEGGASCGCGGYGCLEQYASATAIVRLARETMGEAAPLSAQDVALLARSGNAVALSIFERVGHMLAVGLTGLINTLNMPLYLLGGGVCDAWDIFAPAMFRELRKRSYVYRLTEPEELEPQVFVPGKTNILRAQLGSNAGLLGACLLPLQEKIRQSAVEEGTLVPQ
jgi:glucokinase